MLDTGRAHLVRTHWLLRLDSLDRERDATLVLCRVKFERGQRGHEGLAGQRGDR